MVISGMGLSIYRVVVFVWVVLYRTWMLLWKWVILCMEINVINLCAVYAQQGYAFGRVHIKNRVFSAYCSKIFC